MTAELPPPGWYPDPTGQPGQMYWDGKQWQTTLPPPAWPTTPRSETQAGHGQTPSVNSAAIQGVIKHLGATAWLLIGGFVAATISVFLTWESVTQSVTVFGTTVGSSGKAGVSSGGRFALLVPIVAAAWLVWPVFAGATISPRRLMGLSAVVGLMVLSIPLWFAVFRDNDAAEGITSSYGFGLWLFSAASIVIAAGVVRLWMLRPQGTQPPVPSHDRPQPQPASSGSTLAAARPDPPTLPAHGTEYEAAEPPIAAESTRQEPEAHPLIQEAGVSNPVALGAISSDAISSTAYGPEQIMVELLSSAGMAAFVLLLPIIGLVLLILLFVAASYRQVAKLYAGAGGAYPLARDNFGPRVAQIAAAALLIDYVATVAVQCAAGTVAVESAFPVLASNKLEIAVGAVLVMGLVSLLGLRRPGRIFAVITYSFVVLMTAMIVAGLTREALVGLPEYNPSHMVGAVPVHQGGGLVMGATVLVLLRAFVNGGSSLTGLETISDAGEVFREPKGRNARRALTVTACILGFLLIGVAALTHLTHATPYLNENTSMLSEIARAVFGSGMVGHVLFLLVQAATAAILFTGASVGFNRFAALTSLVAKVHSRPHQGNRGYEPAFFAGVAVLTLLSVALLVVTAASVTALVVLYAIGVFISFAMAGYGMTKHHLTHRERGWAPGLLINLTAGVLSSIVAMIFVVTKFTEGAWLVILVLPILVVALIVLDARSVSRPAV